MSAVLEKLHLEAQTVSYSVGDRLIPPLGFRPVLRHTPQRAYANFFQIPVSEGQTLWVGREIPRPEIADGRPDFNKIAMFIETPDGVNPLGYLEIPNPKGHIVVNWEDGRVADYEGRTFQVCWTALEQTKDPARLGEFDPYPARTLAHIDLSNRECPIIIDQSTVYSNVIGKDFAPASRLSVDDIDRYLIRKNGDEQVFWVVKAKGEKLVDEKRIPVPKREYSKLKSGLNCQDAIMTDGNRFLPDHGVNKGQVITEEGRKVDFPRYAIGATVLSPDWDVVARTLRPLFVAPRFGERLNPFKDAIYSVHGTPYPWGMDFGMTVNDLSSGRARRTTAELSRALGMEIGFALQNGGYYFGAQRSPRFPS